MPPIDLGDDDGFAKVKIGDVEISVDIFRACNRHNEFWRECASPESYADSSLATGQEWHAYYSKICSYLEDLGFGSSVSHRAASRFAVAIGAAAKDIEKKGGGDTGSPDSTA